jgi:anti-sigma factor RsiW
MTWHIDMTTAARYVDGRLDPTGSASVEAHLERCGSCRAEVGEVVVATDGHLLDDVWRSLTAVVDEPRVGRVETALRRIGVDEATARIVSATRHARRAHLLASMLCVLLAVVASRSAYDQFFVTFIAVAPLGPLLATAWAFGRGNDVVAQLTGTLPYSALRTLLIRTAAAVIPALVVTAISLPWLMDRGWMAVAWLLPALALVVCTVALSSWMSVEWAALTVGVVWFAGVLTLRVSVSVGAVVDAIAGPIQIVSLASVFAGVAIITVRRTAYEYREV